MLGDNPMTTEIKYCVRDFLNNRASKRIFSLINVTFFMFISVA